MNSAIFLDVTTSRLPQRNVEEDSFIHSFISIRIAPSGS
jgi:hypothetical protein